MKITIAQNVILLIFIIIQTSTISYSQETDILFNYYFQNDLVALKAELSKYDRKTNNNLQLEFYSAIFLTDGEAARQVYQQIFDKGSGRIKLLAAERLYQYYYAKGYYVNATRYQKFMAENELPISNMQKKVEQPPTDDVPRIPVQDATRPVHFIQVGAFSIRENAAELSKMLKTQNIESKIVKRQIGESELYCVWIPGKAGFNETLEYANTIKIKYDLNFRIIKE